ncbi:hypothetical protein L1049_027980 [Liquidambar formosana]|uniref:EF-hand domain-containing protein n=1 Tax=Liquidambar formosana TaxID=63359 RepID=A0AAP0RIY1_LIQFO
MKKSGEFERVFRYFDADGDGKISPSELKNRISLVGNIEVLLKEMEAAVEIVGFGRRWDVGFEGLCWVDGKGWRRREDERFERGF